MREIDGSYGEGGGQLVRTACALAAITGEPLTLSNIRVRRTPPGLAPQHLTAVRAVASMCDAEVEGLAVRSRALSFRPGRPRGGRFVFDVGTAGSIPLVVQAVLPVALASGAPVRMRLIGGTDIRAAPPLDYLRHVFLPLLAGLGLEVKLTLVRRGYYPRGGGEVEIEVQPGRPRALQLETPGPLREIAGIAHVANLPAHIAERMQHAARQVLSAYPPAAIEEQVLGRDRAIGPGGAIVLWARTAHSVLGGAAVAQRGVPAEQIGADAAHALLAELTAGAALDIHAADQILIYLAQARAASVITVRELSSHARSTLWLLQQFLPLRAQIAAHNGLTRVELAPG
ncbi:MAG: RNA 3'-terminal phosphate cyclase [Gammaproteobacteria bacterium]|nr:RNA 3'-terminal phosphate cyclase [Gammaproteobacteria bacterium]